MNEEKALSDEELAMLKKEQTVISREEAEEIANAAVMSAFAMRSYEASPDYRRLDDGMYEVNPVSGQLYDIRIPEDFLMGKDKIEVGIVQTEEVLIVPASQLCSAIIEQLTRFMNTKDFIDEQVKRLRRSIEDTRF